jgi:pimeloyl-ACP methyl ester carboxylesterase
MPTSLLQVPHRRQPRRSPILQWSLGLLLGALAVPALAGPPAPAPAQAAASGFVTVPGGKLYYEAMGEGPALVLVHDGLLHEVTWDAQFPVFARSFRTIRYDRRGYGRSETATRDFSAVDDLLAVLDALGAERAVLVGCSSGGGLVVDFTLAHPERVSGLVLEGAVISGLGYSEHYYHRSLVNFRPQFQSKDLAGLIEAWATDPYLTDAASTAARRRLREVLAAYPHQVDGSLPEGRQPARPAAVRLREIHVPALILTGAGDIPDVQAHAGALQAGIAGARREVLAGAGHLAHLEQPERFNAAVLAFLRPEEEAARYLAALADDKAFDYDGARRLFEYDFAAPLDVREAGREERPGATIVDLSYASPMGGRVPAYLVLPRRRGVAEAAAAAGVAGGRGGQGGDAALAPHPAAIFVHPGQGNRGTFLDEAVELAGRGLISLLLGAPFTRPEYPKGGKPFDGDQDRRDFVQTAIDVRRGFDLLAGRPDVDADRLGYVGHSLGATIGGPLLATESRVRAWVMMAGFAAQTREWAAGSNPADVAFRTLLPAAEQQRYLAALAPIDGVRFLTHSRLVPVLLQFARRDEFIAPWDAALWVQATPGPTETIWYDTDHRFDADARKDRDAWLLRQLVLAQPPAGEALFAMRSAFWINLHHFLHATARGGDDSPPAAGGPLTPGERRAWEQAVAVYRRDYAGRDLLFDQGMIKINLALAAAANAPHLTDGSSASLPAALVSTLEAAAPVYRAHWWPAHDAANRAWIAAVTPRLARFGPAIAARLTRAYRVEWPAEPIAVDLTHDAGPFGAYTTDQPFTHVTLSSADPRESGDSALESLFHEASHGWDQELIDGVAKAAADRGRPEPENLWHAILFYTAGESTRYVLAEAGQPPYTPYAFRTGVYDRGAMKPYPPALQAAWQPYLDGHTDFASAMRALIDALPAAQ